MPTPALPPATPHRSLHPHRAQRPVAVQRSRRGRVLLALATVVIVIASACGADRSTVAARPGGKSDATTKTADDGSAEGDGAGSGPSSRRSSTTLDPRGEADGLHCGLPTAGPPPVPPGATPPSTAFPQPVNDFPLSVTLSPSRGDPRDKVRVKVTAGRPKALIVLFAVWSDGKDHDVRAAEFADVAGRAEFTIRVPAGIPPGLARITISAQFTVGDRTDSALVQETFTVTGPGCP